MNIYLSGINGAGIGPLAELAQDAGITVFGSDQAPSLITNELVQRGISIEISDQNGEFLQSTYDEYGIDWFVYTSALSSNHPELLLAQRLGIRTSKRDDFINYLIQDKSLNLIAIAGTHGKTTTTCMLIWTLLQLQIPISYLVGTTLSFAPSGRFDPKSKYLIYECDEYDHNFLKFSPFLSAVTSMSYDHPDIYPSIDDYTSAFRQFIAQSDSTTTWQSLSPKFPNLPNITYIDSTNKNINLLGSHNRENATLVLTIISQLFPDLDQNTVINALNQFPGSTRRFEKLADNLYTDYAHHPEEIQATIQLAQETGQKLAVIYQPHQNSRQHQLLDQYQNAFTGADLVLWLPTFLTRDNPNLPILHPNDFIARLHDPTIARLADLNPNLIATIKSLIQDNYLVILMSAGPADEFLRQNLRQIIS